MLKQTFVFPNIDENLDWNVSSEELHEEFFWYLDHPEGELTLRCTKNKIVKYFQQDTFYLVEKYLWQDKKIRAKLLANRLKYLNKSPEELTTYDILSGFKKSAIHYGYSGFNPQLCKWFYQWCVDNTGMKMNEIVCYDPCGGWGHRMIGSTEIKKYIYNDLSEHTAQGVQNIKDYFEFFNAEIHNEDSVTWQPDDDFNVMFTCPPYFNVEPYECGDFDNKEDFDAFLQHLYDVYNEKESCKIFGMVMRDDLIDCLPPPNHSFELSKNRAIHLMGEESKNKEYLYIWVKEI